jgi:hypothetical protein
MSNNNQNVNSFEMQIQQNNFMRKLAERMFLVAIQYEIVRLFEDHMFEEPENRVIIDGIKAKPFRDSFGLDYFHFVMDEFCDEYDRNPREYDVNTPYGVFKETEYQSGTSFEWMIPFFKMKSFRPFLCEKFL